MTKERNASTARLSVFALARGTNEGYHCDCLIDATGGKKTAIRVEKGEVDRPG